MLAKIKADVISILMPRVIAKLPVDIQKLFTDGYYQRHFTQDELNRILLQIGFNNINFEIGHMQKSYLPFFPKNSFIDNFLKKNFGWFLIAEFKK